MLTLILFIINFIVKFTSLFVIQSCPTQTHHLLGMSPTNRTRAGKCGTGTRTRTRRERGQRMTSTIRSSFTSSLISMLSFVYIVLVFLNIFYEYKYDNYLINAKFASLCLFTDRKFSQPAIPTTSAIATILS